MRLLDYAVKNDGPIRIALDRAAGEDRGAAARRRRHPSSRLGEHRAERRAHRAEGVGRREPRHPPGLLPRRARLGPGGAASAAIDGPLRAAAVLRHRDDHRRPGAPLLGPERARRHQRDHSFRSRRHPARRRGGDAGRRTRPVRRPDRVRRVPARHARRHGARRGDAPADSGRHPLGRGRRPRAARQLQVADARRRRHGQERDLEPPHRHAGQHLRSRVAALGRRRRRRPCRRGGVHAAAEVRPAAPRAVHAAGREQPGAAGRERRPHAARHLRSPGGHGARRHRARRGDVRGAPLPHLARIDGLHEPGADRAVLRRRGGDQRARARARPIA